MITFQDAVTIRNRVYSREMAQRGEVRETDNYWWLPDPEPIMGSRGIIIDKADGHFHRLGSALRLEEWFFAHELGFRHRDYIFRITAIRDIAQTLRLLWDIRYTHVKALSECPPFELPFSWGCFPFLPRIVAADFFDYQFTVSGCDNERCNAIGLILPQFNRIADRDCQK